MKKANTNDRTLWNAVFYGTGMRKCITNSYREESDLLGSFGEMWEYCHEILPVKVAECDDSTYDRVLFWDRKTWYRGRIWLRKLGKRFCNLMVCCLIQVTVLVVG